ncbi:ATP synthase F1 subunit delta [Desulfocurvus sp. DL9XJH121]
MTADIVARRYARALFSIAKSQGDANMKAYGKDLAEIAATLTENPELLRVFKNPLFSVEEKKAIVDKLLAHLAPSATTKNFCFLLADKDRLSKLPEIEAYYGALLDEANGVVRGQLVTAIELGDAKQEEVKKQLAAQLGKELILDFTADADILGGVVLKVGDKILDASLKAQLNAMKEQIKRGE